MKDKLDLQNAFVKMRIEGRPLLEIAPALNISIATAYRWNRVFKSDILAVRDARVEALRQKVLEKYNSYFDFLDSQLEKIKAEIELHEEIPMTYERCIKNSIKILEAQNRLNIFRKFSYKPFEDNSPDIPEDEEKEEDVENSKGCTKIEDTLQPPDLSSPHVRSLHPDSIGSLSGDQNEQRE
ncbi:MAG: hypothetical protein LWX07_12990 [Bacteroidetes bacterium]|nr:hypothetical protein [Bacteroidota bacterium]